MKKIIGTDRKNSKASCLNSIADSFASVWNNFNEKMTTVIFDTKIRFYFHISKSEKLTENRDFNISPILVVVLITSLRFP